MFFRHFVNLFPKVRHLLGTSENSRQNLTEKEQETRGCDFLSCKDFTFN